MAEQRIEVGFVVFPDVTQLDLTGPLETLSRIAGPRCRLIWKTKEPVRADKGFVLTPDATFEDVDRVDIICIPGGMGIYALLEDDIVLREVRRLASTARYVTSVCTGALVLGAAGLLVGKRATTHWRSLEFLPLLGAAHRPVGRGCVLRRHPLHRAGVDDRGPGAQLRAQLSHSLPAGEAVVACPDPGALRTPGAGLQRRRVQGQPELRRSAASSRQTRLAGRGSYPVRQRPAGNSPTDCAAREWR